MCRAFMSNQARSRRVFWTDERFLAAFSGLSAYMR
jgi:hypothetical protein